MWLHQKEYSKSEARPEVIVYLQVALPFKPEDSEAGEAVTLNAFKPKVKSKENKKK